LLAHLGFGGTLAVGASGPPGANARDRVCVRRGSLGK
jgi:hypothetical protein